MAINQVAVALGQATQAMDRRTGVSHSFSVHVSKADGTGRATLKTSVIALNWADAWGLMGDAIGLFMNSENGRTVHSVTADR